MNQYFQVGLFIKVLHKMVISFESVDDMLQYDHSNKSYWTVLSCDSVYYSLQGGSNFESVDKILQRYWAVLP